VIYEWNAYKIFLNGKRAKRPSITFKHEDENTVGEHFESKVKRRLGKKLKSSEFAILRADLPQNSKEELQLAEKKMANELRNRVIRKHFKNIHAKGKIRESVNYGAGMILCKESDWKWQWAILENATNRYVKGISPGFAGFLEAEKWMEEQIGEL